ncbi:MAG: hypothetical protein QOE55_3479 [Acidobacteriaceae bacterium]|jgi:hypothetical protein|nr:hypothetical protein [Acidobacteriaceae bacterium]
MKLTLSDRSTRALEKLITGDKIKGDRTKPDAPALTPYRSGPDLVNFFNEFAGNDSYGEGLPSRWRYVRDKLESHNGTHEH